MNYIGCGNWYFLKFWERPLVWLPDLSFLLFVNAWRQRIKKEGFYGWLKILLLFYLKMAALQHGMKFAFLCILNIVMPVVSISDSFCHITCFHPCIGARVHSLHPSDHSKLSSSPILSQSSFPISASPFPHRRKKFNSIWNTSVSYTLHFNVKFWNKKKSLRVTSAKLQFRLTLPSWVATERSAGLLRSSALGWQRLTSSRSSHRRFWRHMWSAAQGVDELCEVFVSTSAALENGRQKRINSMPLFHSQMWSWNAGHLSQWLLEYSSLTIPIQTIHQVKKKKDS